MADGYAATCCQESPRNQPCLGLRKKLDSRPRSEKIQENGATASLGGRRPRTMRGHQGKITMDPAITHWVGLWDYLDGNFWSVWNWAASRLTPADVAWQPMPQVASIGWNLQHLGE